MPAALFRAPTREELELTHKRHELSALRAIMAERERSLEHLRDQLHSFEARYIRQVGVLYRQLDEWETRVAELHVSRETMEETERILQEELQREAQKSPRAAPLEQQDSETSLDLKNLFREVAKRIHPDFATDHHDERHRTRLMAQANEAFRREDTNLLQRMLNGHDAVSDSHRREDTDAALARTLTQIDQTKADTAALEAELEALSHSEMAQLRQRTLEAAAKGRDLLAEMAARVKGSIGIAMRRFELDTVRARRNEPVFNPDELLSAETSPRAKRR
jgi:hypothetical protein